MRWTNNRVDPTASLHVLRTEQVTRLWSAVGHPWR